MIRTTPQRLVEALAHVSVDPPEAPHVATTPDGREVPGMFHPERARRDPMYPREIRAVIGAYRERIHRAVGALRERREAVDGTGGVVVEPAILDHEEVERALRSAARGVAATTAAPDPDDLPGLAGHAREYEAVRARLSALRGLLQEPLQRLLREASDEDAV